MGIAPENIMHSHKISAVSAIRIVIALGSALLIAIAGFVVFAGYFDRDTVVDVAAAAKPPVHDSHVAAVLFSGDIGYRIAMGRMIGDRLSADGIPVVAVNSLGYFRTQRSLAEVTALTQRVIRRALTIGDAKQVVLIGHSFGADILQAGLVGLPPDLREKVRTIVLIVPTKKLFLRISIGEMLDLAKPDADALPTMRALTWAPVTCIYGINEGESPCPELNANNVRKVGLSGGHALNWDITAVYRAIQNASGRTAFANVTKVSAPAHQAAMLRPEMLDAELLREAMQNAR